MQLRIPINSVSASANLASGHEVNLINSDRASLYLALALQTMTTMVLCRYCKWLVADRASRHPPFLAEDHSHLSAWPARGDLAYTKHACLPDQRIVAVEIAI